jgi:hypothetical protein
MDVGAPPAARHFVPSGLLLTALMLRRLLLILLLLPLLFTCVFRLPGWLFDCLRSVISTPYAG